MCVLNYTGQAALHPISTAKRTYGNYVWLEARFQESNACSDWSSAILAIIKEILFLSDFFSGHNKKECFRYFSEKIFLATIKKILFLVFFLQWTFSVLVQFGYLE